MRVKHAGHVLAVWILRSAAMLAQAVEGVGIDEVPFLAANKERCLVEIKC